MYPEGSFLAQFQGEPCGIAMSRPGRLKPFIGPLIANSADVARKLLGYLLNYWKGKDCGGVFIDVPENHFETASRWESEMKCATPPANCVLGPEIQPARGLVRMYELISADNFIRLTARKSDDTRPVRSIDTLEHGRAAFEATVTYMKQEIETLRYIYATGGPELS